jgi:hypothetical protein
VTGLTTAYEAHDRQHAQYMLPRTMTSAIPIPGTNTECQSIEMPISVSSLVSLKRRPTNLAKMSFYRGRD